MDDVVFNAMTSFQFFCNDYFKHKNIDKLMPKGMSRSEWNIKKDVLLNEEIESVNHYLEEQAAQRLQNFAASANKNDIEKRFTIIIREAIDSYKAKIKNYYLY